MFVLVMLMLEPVPGSQSVEKIKKAGAGRAGYCPRACLEQVTYAYAYAYVQLSLLANAYAYEPMKTSHLGIQDLA